MSCSAIKSSPWGCVEVKKAQNLRDIINDQEQYVFPDDVVNNRQAEDDDYQFALSLQNEELSTGCKDGLIDDDEKLAEILQQLEDENQQDFGLNTTDRTSNYSKITVNSVHNQNSNQSRKSSSIESSDFLDAVSLEHSLQHSSRDVQQLFKHDPLLQGLSNSAALSELDGVGDLLGSKLLVSNTVANSLKTFVHKNEDRQIQMKINKSKKTANVTLKPSSTPLATCNETVPLSDAVQSFVHECKQQSVDDIED